MRLCILFLSEFYVADSTVRLCGCWGDRWLVWYDGQCGGKGFCNAGLLCSFLGQFINVVISNGVCVGYGFTDANIVVGCF